MTDPRRYIAFDFETHLFGPGVPAPKPVCMSFAEGDDVAMVTAAESAAKLLVWLEDPRVVLVCANLGFDLGVALTWAPDPDRFIALMFAALDTGRLRCVQSRDKLILLAEGRLSHDAADNMRQPLFSLAALASRYLSVQMDKGADTWRTRYAELDGLPIDQYPPEAVEYSLRDAAATLAVFHAQNRVGQAPKLSADTFVNEVEQTDAHVALHLFTMTGIEIATEDAARLQVELRAQVEAVHAQYRAAGIMREDGSKDMKKLRARIEAAYAAKGTTPPITNSGATSTAADTLASSGDALLVAASEVASAEKLLSAFLPSLSAGVVNPSYDVLKETGRTSGLKPNIQQMPRKGGIREMFRPPAGHAFVDADYSFVELVALAQVCLDLFGYSKLADTIRAGRDPHLATAADLVGVRYEEAAARYKAGDVVAKDMRQLSKALNFGLPGGLGPDAFVEYARTTYNVTIAREEAADLKHRWLGWYPEMLDYFQHVARMAGAAESFSIEQLRSGRVRGGCRYTSGCNTYFQGLAADGAKRAMCRIVRECLMPGTALYGCLPHAFVHDEFLVSAPLAQVHAAAERLSVVMVESMAHFMPDVPVSVEVEAMDRWSKSAKRIVSAEGVLQVWTPTPADPAAPAAPEAKQSLKQRLAARGARA